jgi:hypothetical protein
MPSWTFLYTGVIVPASVTIPVGIAVSRYRYVRKPLRSILLYLIVAGTINGIAAFLAYRKVNNLPLLHIYTMIELVLLMRFYRQVITNPAIRRWALLTALIFPVICIINFLFFQDIHTFNSYTRPLESIILITFGIIYLGQQTDHEPVRGWGIPPETWIVIGMLLYFSSALFQFIFSNVVSNRASLGTRLLIWDIHASLVLIMYFLFATGFAKCKN